MKKIFVIALVGVISLALLALLGYRLVQSFRDRPNESARQRGGAVPVETTAIERGTIAAIAQFTGSLAARSQVTLAPKIAGRLERLHVDIGDSVRAGQLIAVLDAEEYAQQVRQARAELEVARASLEETRSALEKAERDHQRVLTLFQREVASEAERDTVEAQLKAQQARLQVAQAQVTQREAALRSAEVRLSYTEIRADWEGNGGDRIVGERFVDAGAMLRANDPIATILDIGALTAVVFVVERDYSQIVPGQTAQLSTDAFPGRAFTGRVARIAPLLRENSRQARVEIVVGNEEGLLKPGMFVRAQIELAREADAQIVPFAALVRRDGRQGVFVVEKTPAANDAPPGARARFTPVAVGITQGERVQVVEPALDGPVVTLGQHLLQDGASVLLPEARRAGNAGGEGGQRRRAGDKGRVAGGRAQ